MKNDTDRVTLPGSYAANTVPQVHAVGASCSLDRAGMNRNDAVTLTEGHNHRTGLHAWPPLRHDEFASRKTFARLGQQNRQL